MRTRLFVPALAVALALAAPAGAQFKKAEKDPQGTKLAEATVQKWRCGMTITADGDCLRIVATTPIPIDWPEQKVRVVQEDITSTARVSYQMVDNTVKQMVVTIPRMAGGEEAHAIVTLEISRSPILAPDDTTHFRLPDVKKLDRTVRPYLGVSPYIETHSPKIVATAKKIAPDEKQAWAKVEAIYDWVREHVKYENGPLQGALWALNQGKGDCEEITSLFIALCRVNDIPARTVHVPGHCYPEFYLEDEKGVGRWFPCQSAGSRSFGGIPETRPVLEKGDNFRDPRNPKEHHHYLPETLTGSGNGGQPHVSFIRELLPN